MSTILVTGAARGIGHKMVERAIARGDTVFAVVRKQADAQRFTASDRLHVVLMDMASTEAVAQGFAQVDQLLQGRPLDAVVHCAAVSMPGAIEVAPMSEFETTYNTNILGALRMLKESIPRLRGHGGRLVLVSSLWGQAAGPMLGGYSSSKHAIEALADIARRETAGMNLHIIVAEPGVVLTDMLTGQSSDVGDRLTGMPEPLRALYGNLYQRYAKVTATAKGITADQCCAGIEAALNAAKPATRYPIGTDSKMVCFLNWLLPDRLMDKVFAATLNNKPL